jgi:signal transduction histidine kinase
MPPDPSDNAEEAGRLRRRLERERKARQEAEAVSERGLRQLYERNQQLALLEKIATAANQTTAADDALRFAVREICVFSGWDVGHVYRIEGIAGARQLRSARIWYGPDAIALVPFRRTSEEVVFSEGIGLPGRVIVSGTAEWIRDVCEDANFPRGRFARQCGLRAASAFPVLSGDHVVAVLEFFAFIPREPDESLLHILSQIGLQLGRAIERQRDAETVNRRAEELMQARDHARSADRAKSEFLANMSHELRTPLNSIIGFSELMMKETFGPHNIDKYRDYSQYIFNSGRHLLSIINDILDLSKIEAGRGSLDQEEPIALAVLIGKVRESVCLHAEQKRVALEVAVEAGLPELLGSARMVRQILTNLVSNALKFTPEGGIVTVTAALAGDGGLLVRVSDTGIGMSEAEIVVALTPFGQVDSTLSRSHEGTGLGLPLARAMAKLHQAEFRVGSVKGAGTSVEIAFPAARLIRLDDEPARACA